MQKPDVFPSFIQLCFELLHLSIFNYFLGKEFHSSTTLWEKLNFLKFSLLDCFMIFMPWPRVSLEFIVKTSLCFQIINSLHDKDCLNHSHASSPVQKAGQVQCSQSVLVAPVPKVWYQSCHSSLCIFQLGNIYFQMQTLDAVRVVHVRSHQ